MRVLLIILFLTGQLALKSQSSFPVFANGKKDATTFIQYLPVKADFVFVYSEESYWGSNTENFILLVRTPDNWQAWSYYRKWKKSSDVYNNKGKKKRKFFRKREIVDSFSVKTLFDSLALYNFWTLSDDSLNETRGLSISDHVSYIFQTETFEGKQILESYAPEYYLKQFPDMQQRHLFMECKGIFRRWWTNHVVNKK